MLEFERHSYFTVNEQNRDNVFKNYFLKLGDNINSGVCKSGEVPHFANLVENKRCFPNTGAKKLTYTSLEYQFPYVFVFKT